MRRTVLGFVEIGAVVLAMSGARADSTFLRGDANGDGVRSLADAAFSLRYLFRGNVAPECLDAADTNDDGNIDLGDCIDILNGIFLGGPLPPLPSEVPGPDPTPDDLTCLNGQPSAPGHDSDQRIAIGSASGAPGDVVDVPVLLTNTADAEGIQVTLTYDAQALVKGDASFAPLKAGNKPDFAAAEEQESGILRVGILVDFFMVSATQIHPATDTEVVMLRFRIEEGAAHGLYPLAVVRDEISSEISEMGNSIVPLLLDGSVAVATVSVAPPSAAGCTRRDGGADITWTNGDTYSEVRILRDGEGLAALPGNSTSYRDAVVDDFQHGYLIYGIEGGVASVAASCTVPGPLPGTSGVPAPADLTCGTNLPEIEVVLTWTNGAAYDAVRIWRDGELVAELPGTAEGWTDAVGVGGRLTYLVAGVVGGELSGRAGCEAGVWNEPPDGLRCSVADGPSAELEWANPQSYDEIRIYRDGVLIDTLPGNATAYTDPGPLPVGVTKYSVEGVWGDLNPESSSCNVEVPDEGPGAAFLRGDANTDGMVTIADACFTLTYLFANGETPDCIDAIDVDDNGMLTIADAVFSLNYLYAGGSPPPAPFGAPGLDPTPDGASCAAGLTRQASHDNAERLAIGILRAEPGETVVPPVKITNAKVVDGFQCEFTFDGTVLTLGKVETPGAAKPDFARLSVVGPGRARIGLVQNFFMDPGEMIAPGADQVVAQIPVTVAGGAARSVYPLAFVRGGRENELSEEGLSVIPSLEDGAIVVASSVIAPPHDLACEEQGGEVVLAWANGQAYDQVIVLRNAEMIAELDGTATTLRDPEPGPIAVYWVYGVRGGDPSAAARCSVGDGVIPGPADLACAIDAVTWDVTLEWTNPVAYDGIEILRNGAELANLPGDAASYTDLDIGPSNYLYVVVGIIDGIHSESAFCHIGTTVAAPLQLSCQMHADCDVRLAWTNAETYDAIRITRGGQVLAEIAGDATSYQDTSCLPVGASTYRVIGIRAPFESPPASCSVENEGPVDSVGDLSCTASDTGVRLTWVNRDAYDEIVISRDGDDIAVLPGDRQEYVGEPVTTSVTFGVRGRIDDVDGPVSSCVVNGGILFAAGDMFLSGAGDQQACPIFLTCDLDTQGFSFGLTHDPEVVSAANVMWEGTSIESVKAGGPDFFRWHDETDPLAGITVGIVFDFFGVGVLPGSTSPQVVMQVLYQAAGGAQAGDSCPLAFTDLLGSPQVETIVVSDGVSFRTRVASGSATIGAGEPHFKRGDCNDDGSLDIADPIALLNYMFAKGPAPGCLDWADANDDGKLDIADPIVIAIYVTGGGGPLMKAPLEECGPDPTPDDLPPCTAPSFACQ
ncbi:MAG: hypothetical protein JXP34_26925 [Planctomycetes bacterium]|nr:hypothetical protein [Planctomycetota bacterium]